MIQELQVNPGKHFYCLDVNECLANEGKGPCEQECTNTEGSYRCSCTNGRVDPRNQHSCLGTYVKFASQ